MNAAITAHSITVFLNVSDAGKFSLTLGERWLIMRRNSKSTFAVRVASSGGFNSPVNLSVNGLPQWITATFSPNPVMPNPGGATTNLTITTANSYGAFTLSIAGTGGSQTRSVPLLLIVW